MHQYTPNPKEPTASELSLKPKILSPKWNPIIETQELMPDHESYDEGT